MARHHDTLRDHRNTALTRARRQRALRSASQVRFEWLEERTLLSALTIAQENQLPGTPQSTWDISGAGDTTLQGFATDISVDVGQTVSFKITDTTLGSYHIEIYRLGYYQGDGARLVTTIASGSVTKTNQPAGIVDSTTGELDCGNWSISASWAVPSDATSGVYIADLVRDTNGARSQIPFIVRNDASTSQFVFQTSDPTWEAYNDYGGKSLYDYQSNNQRAYAVSYNRPFNTRGDSAEDYLFSAETPMIYWMEENGYDVSYIAGVDTDRYGASLLQNHRIFLSNGHDEYWSPGQRTNVQNAIAGGMNAVFFSGNEVSWETRYADSIDGSNTPYRTLVCYKDSIPGTLNDPSGNWTGEWADPRFSPPLDGGNPGETLTGQAPVVNDGAKGAIQVTAAEGKTLLWANTSVASLAAGQTATLTDNTLGYEWDEPLDNGYLPNNAIFLSTTTVVGAPVLQGYGATYASGTATQHLEEYKAPSGAIIFSTGVVQWSWGLSSIHDTDAGTSTVDPRIEQATVNLYAQMGAQPATLIAGLVKATKSTDVTPPTSAILSPANGSSLAAGTTVTISGSASDSGGGVVAGVSISTDGGVTWHPASGTTSWTYSWAPATAGSYTIEVRATDDSLNTQTTPTAVTVNVTGMAGQSALGSILPTGTAQPDSALELGMKFAVDVPGQITGVRFYKFAGNTGTHIGNLWTSTGAKLATVTFTNESASGWQYAAFSSPVNVVPGQTYVISYFDPAGNYAEQDYYFYSQSGTQQIHGLQDNAAGGNGVYSYSASSTFPNNSAVTTSGDLAANYFVDAIFQPAADTTAPSISSATPASGATAVATTSPVTVTFSEAVKNDASLSIVVKNASNQTVPGTLTYNTTTHTATFVPGVVMTKSAGYTVTVTATDLAGNAMSPANWSFQTAATDNVSLWPASATPTNPADSDTSHVEVGMKFVSSASGYVTAIRFYKGTGNTGTHVGHLWSASGTLLATVTFTGETTTGWQTATLSNPVAISANTTYVVSYYAPNGHYADDDNFFTNGGVSNGPLTAPSTYQALGNGVFIYSTGNAFPNNSFAGGNYWVDVVFSPTATDTTPPSIVSQSPTSGATNVSPNAPVTVTFSEPVKSDTSLSVTLKNGSTTVPGTLSYNAGTFTATFTPSSALALGTTYTVNVTATDVAGNAMTPASWNFSTQSSSNFSVWGGNATPASVNDSNTSPLEVGTKFQSNVAGWVTGVSFYKGSQDTGTHVGHLWSSTGTLLATVTFSNESASGWQTANFSNPVAISANTTYVISYYLPTGHFAADANYFATSGVTNGPLTALSNTAGGGNGVFLFQSGGGFPNQNWQATNYWVDVNFTTTPPADTTPPSITSQSPTSGQSGVSTSAPVKVTFSEAVKNDSSLSITVKNGSTVVPGTLSYNSTTFTATFTPTSALANSATYTVTVTATDLAGNVMTPATWSFTTTSNTAVPPVITGFTPANGASSVAVASTITATFNKAVQTTNLVFTVTDLSNANAAVAGTVKYTAASSTATFTPTSPLAYLSTYSVSVQATDTAGDVMTTPASWVFTTVAAATGSLNVFGTKTPTTKADTDTSAVEVGMKFTSDVAGTVTGMRFYKGTGNTGTHTGHLWSSTGQLLASATFTNETTTGWQTVNFSTPVAITANTVYVISYFAPKGHYAADSGYFTSAAITSGPLHGLQDGASGGNGVYAYGSASSFPSSSYQATNYWVDVLFTAGTPGTPPGPSTTLAVTTKTPASGATQVPVTTTVSAVFNAPVSATSVSLVLKTSGGTAVSATVVYNATTQTVTLTPTAALSAGQTYTATLLAADPLGNEMNPVTWSFST